MSEEIYDEMHVLGRGAFAECRLALRRSDNQLVVIKRFNLTMAELQDKGRKEAIQEGDMLASFSHDNIVRFLDRYIVDDRLNIVMEHADGGTIHDFIKEQDKKFNEDQIWEYFVQMVDALKYLHCEKHVVHRDLKPQNILLNGPTKREIKLADFGIAKHFYEGNPKLGNSLVGTPFYLSPELCKGQGGTYKSDIWALGCILFELTTFRRPFEASNLPAIIMAILRGKKGIIDKSYSNELNNVISSCLEIQPDNRSSITDLYELEIVQFHLNKWNKTRNNIGVARPPTVSISKSTSALLTEMPEITVLASHPSSDSAIEDVCKNLKQMAQEARTSSWISKSKLIGDMLNIRNQISASKVLSVGTVWEALGKALAEVGQFDDAIIAYRNALKSKQASASIEVMEQLANLLPRSAQTMWLADTNWTDEKVKEEACKRMEEGVSILERLCLLGKTAERMCLLGAAYKRRARMDLGKSRKADLKSARDSYALAHLLESEYLINVSENAVPNPYARLNELTFDLLWGNTRKDLLSDILQAQSWSRTKQVSDKNDVWLFIQVADAELLITLLYAFEGEKTSVQILDQEKFTTDTYTETLTKHGSPRVWSSVIDQLEFIITVLNYRCNEEKGEIDNPKILNQKKSMERIATKLKNTCAALSRTSNEIPLAHREVADAAARRASIRLSPVTINAKIAAKEASKRGSKRMSSPTTSATPPDSATNSPSVTSPKLLSPKLLNFSASKGITDEKNNADGNVFERVSLKLLKPIEVPPPIITTSSLLNSSLNPAPTSFSILTASSSNVTSPNSIPSTKPLLSPSTNPFAKTNNSSKRRPSEMLQEIGLKSDNIPEGYFSDRPKSTRRNTIDTTAFQSNIEKEKTTTPISGCASPSNPFAKSNNLVRRRPSEMLKELGLSSNQYPEGYFSDRPKSNRRSTMDSANLKNKTIIDDAEDDKNGSYYKSEKSDSVSSLKAPKSPTNLINEKQGNPKQEKYLNVLSCDIELVNNNKQESPNNQQHEVESKVINITFEKSTSTTDLGKYNNKCCIIT